MGIHAIDNLSHLAHNATEPYVPDRYDYDVYAIRELTTITASKETYWKQVGDHYQYWNDAREAFLKMFCEERRAVKLVGMVFN